MGTVIAQANADKGDGSSGRLELKDFLELLSPSITGLLLGDPARHVAQEQCSDKWVDGAPCTSYKQAWFDILGEQDATHSCEKIPQTFAGNVLPNNSPKVLASIPGDDGLYQDAVETDTNIDDGLHTVQSKAGNKRAHKPPIQKKHSSTKTPPDPWSAPGVEVDKMVWNHFTASYDINTFVYDDHGTLQPVASMSCVK